MGLNARAYILVGLRKSEIDQSKLEGYEDYGNLEEWVWDTKEKTAEQLGWFALEEVSADYWHDKYIGFTVESAADYKLAEIECGSLLHQLNAAADEFFKLFQQKPNTYLITFLTD